MFGLIGLALGVSALGTVASVVQSGKSAKAQQKANDVNRKIQERQASRERLQALREAQIARAQGQQLAANTGTVNSSGFAGQQAGITAQTASNIAFSNQVQTGTAVVSQYTQTASDAANKAANWGALAQFSLAAGSYIGSQPASTTPKTTKGP